MTEAERRGFWSAPAVTLNWLLRLAALIIAILALAHSPWPKDAFAWSWMLFVASFVV